MAEIAIPAIALGAMYILNNHNSDNDEEKTENFENVSASNQRRLTMGDTPSATTKIPWIEGTSSGSVAPTNFSNTNI